MLKFLPTKLQLCQPQEHATLMTDLSNLLDSSVPTDLCSRLHSQRNALILKVKKQEETSIPPLEISNYVDQLQYIWEHSANNRENLMSLEFKWISDSHTKTAVALSFLGELAMWLWTLGVVLINSTGRELLSTSGEEESILKLPVAMQTLRRSSGIFKALSNLECTDKIKVLDKSNLDAYANATLAMV